MTTFNPLEAVSLSVADELTALMGYPITRVVTTTIPELHRQASALSASSADTGVTVTLTGATFGTGVQAGDVFVVLSGALQGARATVASRDSNTQITLAGAGVGANFAGESWEVRQAADTAIEVESTLNFESEGRFYLDGVLYRYSGTTTSTFTGVEHYDGDVWVSGVATYHRQLAEVHDYTRVFSAVDFIRNRFFIEQATGTDLDAIGKRLGALRPPELANDDTYRAYIKAVGYSVHGTEYALEKILDALIGSGNYEIFTDLTGANRNRLNNNNTVFFRSTNQDVERFAGKTFLNQQEIAPYFAPPTNATGIAVSAPEVYSITLAPDPGTRVIDEPSGLTLTGNVLSDPAAGLSADIRVGDKVTFLSSTLVGRTAYVTTVNTPNSVTLEEPTVGLPLSGLDLTGFSIVGGLDVLITRDVVQTRYYRPSDSNYTEDGSSVQEWTYDGGGVENVRVTLASGSAGPYMQMANDVGTLDTPSYVHAARILPESVVELRATVRIDQIQTGQVGASVEMSIDDGVAKVGVGIDAPGAGGFGPNVRIVFSSGSTVLAPIATTLVQDWNQITLRKDGTRGAMILLNGAVVGTLGYSDFGAGGARSLRIEHFVVEVSDPSVRSQWKQVDFQIDSSGFDLANTHLDGTALDASAAPATITSVGDFVPGDPLGGGSNITSGMQVRIKGYQAPQGAGVIGNPRGFYAIDSVNSNDQISLREFRRERAIFSLTEPKIITAVNQARPFVFPDDIGKEITILSPHPDSGIYPILDILREDGSSIADAWSGLSEDFSPGLEDRSRIEEYGNKVLVGGAAPAVWTGVDEEAEFGLEYQAVAGAGATQTVDVEIVNTIYTTFFTIAFPQDLQAVYGLRDGELLLIKYTGFDGDPANGPLSAKLLDDAVDMTVTIVGPPAEYNVYPFYLADEFGLATRVLEALTVAGVIPDFDSFFRDAAGAHIKGT